MTMPETLKPDELERWDIYANTDGDRAWISPEIANGGAWVSFVDVLRLQSDLERVTAETKKLQRRVRHAEALAEKQGKFYRIEKAAATTAESALVKARTALERIATDWHIPEHGEKRDAGSPYDLLWEAIRAARLALSAGEEENGR